MTHSISLFNFSYFQMSQRKWSRQPRRTAILKLELKNRECQQKFKDKTFEVKSRAWRASE